MLFFDVVVVDVVDIVAGVVRSFLLSCHVCFMFLPLRVVCRLYWFNFVLVLCLVAQTHGWSEDAVQQTCRVV